MSGSDATYKDIFAAHRRAEVAFIRAVVERELRKHGLVENPSKQTKATKQQKTPKEKTKTVTDLSQPKPNKAAGKKRKSKDDKAALPPNPECSGLLYPTPKACPGGTRADTLRVWKSHDQKKYCLNCLGKNQRAQKKQKKETK